MGTAALARKKIALRARLIGLALACCLAGTGPALAAEPALTYAIALQAPEAQRKLLENNLDLYRWRDGERMDETQLRRLVALAPEQMRSLLATEGFYSPRVEASLEQNGGAWSVRLEVDPGPPARVGQVDLQVVGPFDDGSADSRARLLKLRTDWSLAGGAVFRHEDWERAKRAALRSLLLDRHPAAAIRDSRATVDPKAHSVALALTLDSGPAFTFGPLQIEGLQRYPASIVERLNPIRPGEPYVQAKLLELQARLQDSPYFASVGVQAEIDPAHPEDTPIKVSVEENRARTLGLGIGMSTDTGPRAQMDYRDLNLLGQAWRLTGSLKLADKEQSLTGELQLPLTSQGDRDSITAQMNRSNVEGEVTRTLILGARRSFLRGRNETAWSLRYYLEQQEVAGAVGDHRSALVPSWSWTRRNVDNLLFPSRGYLFNIQADAAAQALLSDQGFLRGYTKATWFHPLGERGRLILRGEMGAVAADGRAGIPADFLFRSGGDQTVRGYAYQSLGVHEGDAVVGGRWLAVASAEYVHWFRPDWGAAVFIDAGDAADSLDELSPVVGYGLGARWKSPVGPLNLDLARAQETGQLRLHFSVGFSF
ncbi:MAG: autotransporter assembly complex protein TamA [Gallionellaceae bacterium]|nr:autotransporter assembly complex protein TamA [Gallionellaceae bacterium]